MRPLDAEALALFARKGLEAGAGAAQVGEANAVKVRRVMQLTADLGGRPFDSLRILDLGCGDGVYAIEAGLHGAEVVAVDARHERMDEGAACAARHGLDNVRFVLGDVRALSRDTLGEFDVVYCLGLLYHLDAPDVFDVLETVHGLCRRLLVVDSFVSLAPDVEVEHRGQAFAAERLREHEDDDSAAVRRSRLLRSIDNTFAIRFTPAALKAALGAVGFTSVVECAVPLEPGKPADRITVAALKGESVAISTYPWVNEASESEIARRLGGSVPR